MCLNTWPDFCFAMKFLSALCMPQDFICIACAVDDKILINLKEVLGKIRL